MVGGVDLRRGEAVVAEPVDERLRPRRVEIGEHDPLEEVAPLRHGGHGRADAARADDQDLQSATGGLYSGVDLRGLESARGTNAAAIGLTCCSCMR